MFVVSASDLISLSFSLRRDKDIKSLPSSVYEAIQAGAQHDFVNLMIGTNQHETTSFLIGRNATSPVGC